MIFFSGKCYLKTSHACLRKKLELEKLEKIEQNSGQTSLRNGSWKMRTDKGPAAHSCHCWAHALSRSTDFLDKNAARTNYSVTSHFAIKNWNHGGDQKSWNSRIKIKLTFGYFTASGKALAFLAIVYNSSSLYDGVGRSASKIGLDKGFKKISDLKTYL